jgi:hypothetical protein
MNKLLRVLAFIVCPVGYICWCLTGSPKKDMEKWDRKRHKKAVRHWDGYWNL